MAVLHAGSIRASSRTTTCSRTKAAAWAGVGTSPCRSSRKSPDATAAPYNAGPPPASRMWWGARSSSTASTIAPGQAVHGGGDGHHGRVRAPRFGNHRTRCQHQHRGARQPCQARLGLGGQARGVDHQQHVLGLRGVQATRAGATCRGHGVGRTRKRDGVAATRATTWQGSTPPRMRATSHRPNAVAATLAPSPSRMMRVTAGRAAIQCSNAASTLRRSPPSRLRATVGRRSTVLMASPPWLRACWMACAVTRMGFPWLVTRCCTCVCRDVSNVSSSCRSSCSTRALSFWNAAGMGTQVFRQGPAVRAEQA
jgi:hypothetical protein